jgi:hypothetical protein
VGGLFYWHGCPGCFFFFFFSLLGAVFFWLLLLVGAFVKMCEPCSCSGPEDGVFGGLARGSLFELANEFVLG